jgi:hypothetical protein
VIIGLLGAALVPLLVHACGIDLTGAQGTTTPEGGNDAPPPPDPIDAPDDSVVDPTEAGDPDAGCTFLCNGACTPTCATCAGATWACGGACVLNCTKCKDLPKTCVGCVSSSTGVTQNVPSCAATHADCPTGNDACICTDASSCPDNDQVCSGGRCISCTQAVLNAPCKNPPDKCHGDGNCSP